MPLAMSNIAWPAELEEQAAARLLAGGAAGVEVAPTKVWPQPLAATLAEIAGYRHFWESRGLRVVALQSLLFGQNHLQLFGDAALRKAALDYLAGMIVLAGRLGAEVLVFGSPKNRRVGSGSLPAAHDTSVALFRRLGQLAQDEGVWFCIEPNPVQYGCDFITTAAEGLALVQDVNQPGFGLHLDAAAMMLAGDNPEQIMRVAGTWWRHFHISQPYLQPVAGDACGHEVFSKAICSSEYRGWLSIEMKPPDGLAADPLAHVDAALAFCHSAYRASLLVLPAQRQYLQQPG